MTGTLDGTVALVTGASSGIGWAIAKALAGSGATVVGAARRLDRLDALVAEIEANGGRAVAMEADVTDRDQAVGLVEETVGEHGQLDTLVNNAGVMLLGPAVDAPVAEWERMVELNVTSVLHVTHAALPHLLRAAEESRRQVADLVSISSVAGRVSRNGSAVYNLTKAGLGAFSEALRQEVTARHVRVSLVEPGATESELRTHLRPEILERQRQRLGNMEILRAEDVADAVRYIVTRPRHVSINEVLIRPTEQDS
jgi:NADP-dependent 3-hydroxy acid dehydrogenase YdfG